MKVKRIITTLSIAIVGGLIAVFIYSMIVGGKQRIFIQNNPVPIDYAHYRMDSNLQMADFTYAAEKSVHAVVHVKTQSQQETYYNPLLEWLYGDSYRNPQPVIGFGSGVIISKEGYIVTNNHVVENSQKVYVTLNDKREFEAKVIGTDPTSDLALLKIKGEDLPFMTYGNSDKLKVGEWVLAVGNPFNITSTVTAGIVSAKGRDLNIIQTNYRIESFIQTDAAVNRGNSGGALVDLGGDLVGINTAIVSPTGEYAGISFAIPVNIVQKIVNDLIEFGTVQRAILGLSINEINAALAQEKNISKIEGVYVGSVQPDGGAKEAGIQEGDIILQIENVVVNSPAELTEQVSKFRPGDKVNIIIKRNDKTKQFAVTLRNLQGSTKVIKTEDYYTVLGAKFTILSENDKTKFGINNGIKVVEISKGKLYNAGIREGFIVTRVNKKLVYSVEEFEKTINNSDGGLLIEGISKDGERIYFAIGL